MTIIFGWVNKILTTKIFPLKAITKSSLLNLISLSLTSIVSLSKFSDSFTVLWYIYIVMRFKLLPSPVQGTSSASMLGFCVLVSLGGAAGYQCLECQWVSISGVRGTRVPGASKGSGVTGIKEAWECQECQGYCSASNSWVPFTSQWQ